MASQRPFSKDQWRGREREADRQCRGMDGKTICRDKHWHPTAADGGDCCTACQDGVPTTPRRVKGARQFKKMSDGPFLSGIPGLSFHTFFLSPVWNPGTVISYVFPIACLESRDCHFIAFSYLLSGIPGLSFYTFFLSPLSFFCLVLHSLFLSLSPSGLSFVPLMIHSLENIFKEKSPKKFVKS